MLIVNEGALYSDQSKLSVAFYLRAHSIQGRGVFEKIRYLSHRYQPVKGEGQCSSSLLSLFTYIGGGGGTVRVDVNIIIV